MPPKTLFTKIFHKMAFHWKNPQVAVELHFVKSPEMKKMNRDFRGKDKPTDVLSFSSQTPGFLGSIVIDVDTARRQAKSYSHSFERELYELFIHGVLHLMGYDHEHPKDARRMKELEMYFADWLDGLEKRLSSKGRKAR